MWFGYTSSGETIVVFIYDGSTVKQLVDNGLNPNLVFLMPSPQINDNGHVVWQGGTDIFYAFPEDSEDSVGGGGGCFISNLL